MRLSSGARVVTLLVGAVVAGGALLLYEQLRRARSNDFPFLFEPLFLHGLLLVLIGVIAVLMVYVAVTGGRGTSILAALLIGGPSILLAVAPYLIVVREWDFVPDRLVGDGFHQIGMLGIGAALAILALGFVAPLPDQRSREVDAG
ncbi:MAG TPA: hypothetical protein VFV13_08925 [Acidimicrobiia bacterium]|nr:hypothetical protein [Acidimicrobiia bacterium]